MPGSLCSLPSQALGLIDVDKYFHNKRLEWMSPASLSLPASSSSSGRGAALRAILHDRSWAIYGPAQMLCQRAGAQGTARINLRLSELGAQLSGYRRGLLSATARG